MTDATFLDLSSLRFASDALGVPVRSAETLSRRHGDARVLGLTAQDGREAVLKVHETAAKHRREVASYRTWIPHLKPRGARLLAVREAAPAAILLSRLPGRTDLADDDPAAETVHRQAGAWLARLHRLPLLEPDPMPLAEAYRRRADAWVARAEKDVPGATLAATHSILAEALPAMAGCRRVPCHRDAGPRNWLVEGERLTGVIDFEHARGDVAEVDLARLATTVWPRRPALRTAFLDGYAKANGPADPAAPWLPGLLVLEVLGTIVWACRHGDAAFERSGRAALARLLDEALA